MPVLGSEAPRTDERSLCRVLRWDVADAGAPDLLGTVRRRRLAYTATALIAQLHRLDPPEAQQAFTGLNAMTDAAFERLLTSPAVFQLTQVGSVGAAKQLADLVTIEAALTDERTPPIAGWTALGDRWVGPPPPEEGLPSLPPAPIPCALPIDLSLPELLVHPTAGLQQTEVLTEGDLSMAAKLIDESLERVAGRSSDGTQPDHELYEQRRSTTGGGRPEDRARRLLSSRDRANRPGQPHRRGVPWAGQGLPCSRVDSCLSQLDRIGCSVRTRGSSPTGSLALDWQSPSSPRPRARLLRVVWPL